MTLAQKSALITGSLGGIGFATAKALAELARLSQLDPGFDNLAPAGCLMKPGLGRPGRAGTD
jgi:hypothetical protein